MAREIPSKEPLQFNQGDTVKWRVAPTEFPASEGWSLLYSVRGTNKLDLLGVSDGDGYNLTISSGQSSQLTPGSYSWTCYAQKSETVDGNEVVTERYTVSSGSFTILPDLSTVDTAYDNRSQCKKLLDKTNAILEALLDNKMDNFTVDGVTYTQKNVSKLLVDRSKLMAEYDAEQKAERINKGLGGGGKILTRL